jgi:hypothetical protein
MTVENFGNEDLEKVAFLKLSKLKRKVMAADLN